MRLRSRCSVDLMKFPDDERTCVIELSSRLYTGSEVNITYYGSRSEDSLNLKKFTPRDDWELVSNSCQIIHSDYYCCNETVPTMRFDLTFRRKSQNNFLLFVLPAFMLGALVPLSLLLPPDCKERITLESVVVLLSLYLIVTFTEKFNWTQRELPALGCYYIAIMVTSVMSILASTMVLNLHNRAPRRGKVQEPLRGLFLQGLRWVACLDGKTYHPLAQRESMTLQHVNNPITAQDGQPSEITNTKGQDCTKMERNMDELGKNVNALSNTLLEKHNNQENENEWQQVAAIIDRLLFLIFFLIFFISSIKYLT